uniref:G-protein coupled receptors family 3 profile domain-containing protein n=1 Tax=Tetraodon nigroviridis TaxID=99883 RepID=H3CD06_TETNG
MEISALFLGLISLCDLSSAANLKASGNSLEEQVGLREDRTGAGAPFEKCQLQGSARLPAFSMAGDFVIGGVFSLHDFRVTEKPNYTTVPEPFRCSGRIHPAELQFSRAMVFAIEEINNSTELLPGIRLGYQIHDSCAAVPIAVHAAFQLLNGLDPVFDTGDNCSQSGMVMAVVGESGSTQSISISRIIGSFDIPLVSHFATCACLSDKQMYPTFFRTIPSDQFQADALAKLVKHFGWTWIGAVCSDSDYGNNGIAAFLHAAQKEGICVEYSETFYRTHPYSRIKRVADVIRRSTAVVIVAFAAPTEMRILLEELSREPPPPRQWIGSESSVTDPDMLRFSFCAGTIGFASIQRRSVIPGLREFLLGLSLSQVISSSVLTEFWEDSFNCRLGKGERMCDGSEDITTLQSPYTDTSLRITNMVYKAVYAIAHAIHNAVCQRSDSTNQCDKFTRINPKQVLTELKRVNFSHNGDTVSFDANGDPVAKYELVNWKKRDSGSIDVVPVGYYDASLPEGQELRIYRDITWVDGRTQVPASVCSNSCPPGTHKVLQKGKPICCYNCVQCPEGEISNVTDASDCESCSDEFWPNPERNVCVPKPVEFSFSEVLGIILAVFSVGGVCISFIPAYIFHHFRSTAIVKANNSEISFLLLLSLKLCFLCSLLFIGQPSLWKCRLRQAAFGISFVLCLSCLLVKTIVVLFAFRNLKARCLAPKLFGPSRQRTLILLTTAPQVCLCTAWLLAAPSFPFKNPTYQALIVVECKEPWPPGFYLVLGLTAFIYLLLAFVRRKLPDTFNEAKLITFNMMIKWDVWISLKPAYVRSTGKLTVAVEVFAILASSFGLLLCIFLPKCFILLLHPERNVKRGMTVKK